LPTTIRTQASRLMWTALLAAATALMLGVNTAHAAGAHLVKDVVPGEYSSDPLYLEGSPLRIP
jgi:hypothetical protein